MKTCEEYQIDISAMLDGELTPAEIAATVQHLAKCSECERVFEEFQLLQEKVDKEYSRPAVPQELWKNIQSKTIHEQQSTDLTGRVIEFRKWAFRIISVAAGIAITFTAGYFLGKPSAPLLIDPSTPIILASQKGSMSDERFQQLTRELLIADQKYQQKMYFILHALNSEYMEGDLDPPSIDNNDYTDRLRLINSTGDGEIVKY